MNTKTIKEYEALDMILEYLIENIDQKKSFREIHKSVFPGMDINTFLNLSNRLVEFNNIVDGFTTESIDNKWEKEGYLKATNETKYFLESQGGFKKLYEDGRIEKENKQDMNQLKKRSLEDQLKTNKVTRIISILAIIISAIALLVSIFK